MLDTWYQYSLILLISLSFLLGIFSLWKNPKSFTVWIWFLFNMAIVYVNVNFLMSLRTTGETALLYTRLLHVGVPFISAFLFHFVLALLYKNILPDYKLVLRVIYSLAVLFAVLAFTPGIVKGVVPDEILSTTAVIGPLYPILLAYIWLLSPYAIYLLFKEYRGREGAMRRQIFYILLGILVLFIGSIFNYFPHLFGIYPYGNFFMWTFPLFITYGVFIEEVRITF